MGEADFTPVLVELATGVWRLRGKIAANGCTKASDPAKLLQSMARQLDSMADALLEAGVQIQDHTGQPFDSGQSVEMVAYAANDATVRETVIETITPTVYIGGHVVRRGQIVVAGPTPEPATGTPSRGPSNSVAWAPDVSGDDGSHNHDGGGA